MSEDILKELEETMKKAVAENFSFDSLDKVLQVHLDEMMNHRDAVVPKIKDVWKRLAALFIDLSVETDPDKRVLIQRRMGSLKRAHYNYMKSIEIKAAWETAEVAWDAVKRLKNFVLAVIDLTPEP